MNPSQEHIDSVCRIGQGKDCCAFLTLGGGGFECAKGTSLEAVLRARIPTMNAQGDNCSGPPTFQPDAAAMGAGRHG